MENPKQNTQKPSFKKMKIINNLEYNKQMPTITGTGKKANRLLRYNEIVERLREIRGLPLESDKNLGAVEFKKRIKDINREIVFRNKNREKVREISREYEIKSNLPDEEKRATSREDWVKELRNIRNRVKTLKKSTGFIDKLSPQQIIDRVMSGELKLNQAQIKAFYKKMSDDVSGNAPAKYTVAITLIVNGKEMTFNRCFNNTYIQNGMMRYFLENGYFPDNVEDIFGSGKQGNFTIDEIVSIVISRLEEPEHKIDNKDGRFFPYINTTQLNLERYQIYNERQADTIDGKDNMREQCLLYALKLSGIDDSKIKAIKMSYVDSEDCSSRAPMGMSIRKGDLHNMCDVQIGDNIIIHTYDSVKKQERTTKYGKIKQERQIHIALFECHYFIYEDTDYTSYSINNYNEVKEEKEFNRITKIQDGIYKRDKSKPKINSLKLVRLLLAGEHFKKLNMDNFHESHRHKDIKNLTYLEDINLEQQPYVIKEQKEHNTNIWACDTETYTKGEHQLAIITAYQLKTKSSHVFSVGDEYSKDSYWKPANCVNKWLDLVTFKGTKPATVYFHNLKYDKTILQAYLYLSDKCEKDHQIYSLTAYYKKQKITFLDSYKLYNKALRTMPETFNLPARYRKKEAIAYDYYTPENFNKIIPTSEYREYLNNKDKIIFDEEVVKCKSYKGKTFSPWVYYRTYAILDVEVLGEGLLAFDKIITEITENKISLFDRMTISSFADRFLSVEGVYEGVYENSGNLRDYIGNAIRGGRVLVNPKYLKKVVNEKIADYDGVSLYPSSMNRICTENGGIPTGNAIRYTVGELNIWNTKMYSILTVKITKIGKEQAMPMISYKDKDDILQYTNNIKDLPESMIIDSITLEDYIKFCEIEYEVVDGIYWDNGINPKMGETINRLFNARLVAKKAGNGALSETLKLILNSAYGKTGQRKTYDKSVIKNSTKEEFNSFIYNNFNTIKEYSTLNKSQKEVVSYASDKSYNRNHIACYILSMSKRIMNEVFDIANTYKKPIYYTDTDSIHCNYNDVAFIEEKYKEKYGRVLTGKNLGQFHVDFSITVNEDKIKNGKVEQEAVTYDAYSTKFIALGKKSYIDELEAINSKGEKINDYHIRLKGVTQAGVDHAIKEVGCPIKLFTHLADGKSHKFILNPTDTENNKKNPSFLFTKKSVKIRDENTFERILRF